MGIWQAQPTPMPELESIRQTYRDRFGFELKQAGPDGTLVAGEPAKTKCSCGGPNAKRRLQAAAQTLYWGETVINLCCADGFAIWATPIRENNATVGALIVEGVELENEPKAFHENVQRAAEALLALAQEANLVNAAEVQLARQRARREQDRFLAIESAKRDFASDDLRTLYLREEPALLVAIKENRLGDARSILNQILTNIYALAGERLEFLKSCVLELVVMMNRAAVEAGAEPTAALGANYRSLVELAAIEDEEELANWVRRMLESLMVGIGRNHAFPHSLLLTRAINYMRGHLHENLRRDDVARVAGVSPSHFSKLVTERMGRSFTQLLTQMRVDRARELLADRDKSLSGIALECGFYDQSHFNKVFRAAMDMSPGDYRRQLK